MLPPANFLHEREKIENRWPAAVKFVQQNRLNERFGPDSGDIGIVVQGGLFNTLNRALELMELSDAFGGTRLPVYVLNVTYPLIPDEVKEFCAGKRAVLIVEEGQPEFIEHDSTRSCAAPICRRGSPEKRFFQARANTPDRS